MVLHQVRPSSPSSRSSPLFSFSFLAVENGEILSGKSGATVSRKGGEQQKPCAEEEEDGAYGS